MRQIICSDIDGTLLDSNRDLSPATVAVLRELSSDFEIVLASSRMPKAMSRFHGDIGLEGAPLICYNGAYTLDAGGGEIYSLPIAPEMLAAIFDHNQHFNYNVSVYERDNWYVEREDFWTRREINNTRVEPKLLPNTATLSRLEGIGGAHKVMCMGAEEEIDDLLGTIGPAFGDALNLYRSKPTYLEISNKQVNKWSALQRLIEPDDAFVLGFGDNYNDLELVREADIGVAVANAREEIKAVANFVTKAGKENGVAVFLRDYLEGKFR